MDEAPATPSPNVSDGSNMDTEEEDDILAYHGLNRNASSDEDGFVEHPQQRPQGSVNSNNF